MLLATISSGYAIHKVIEQKSNDATQNQTNTTETTTDSSVSLVTNDSQTPTVTTTEVTTSADTGSATLGLTPGTATFTLAELATHNKSGDCYVAYNGTVYDVSNDFSWSGCSHHGISGGQDITSLFPHPTSYLSRIPAVGILESGTATATTTNTSIGKNEDENEYEYEYQHEYQYEYENENDD